MKAIIRTKAGKNLSTMQVQEIDTPKVAPNEVKVKMVAARINPVDLDLMKGMPFLKYKKPQIGGIDGAGEIIDLGSNVRNFSVGDKVFFYRLFSDIGTWAEEISIPANHIAKIPEKISVQDAGSIALPLLTAYDSLQQFQAKVGEKILIHGAAGGVGFPATQIAKKMGLQVTATAGQGDFEILEKAQVDTVINYKTQAFEMEIKEGELDYVFDVLGKDVLLKSIALKPKKVVSVAYTEVEKLPNTGVKLPGILKPLITMSMGKFRKAAKKHKVHLIGQVTGANGKLLQEASDFINDFDFQIKPYPTITLNEIAQNGFGEKPLGKVILF